MSERPSGRLQPGEAGIDNLAGLKDSAKVRTAIKVLNGQYGLERINAAINVRFGRKIIGYIALLGQQGFANAQDLNNLNDLLEEKEKEKSQRFPESTAISQLGTSKSEGRGFAAERANVAKLSKTLAELEKILPDDISIVEREVRSTIGKAFTGQLQMAQSDKFKKILEATDEDSEILQALAQKKGGLAYIQRKALGIIVKTLILGERGQISAAKNLCQEAEDILVFYRKAIKDYETRNAGEAKTSRRISGFADTAQGAVERHRGSVETGGMHDTARLLRGGTSGATAPAKGDAAKKIIKI